MTYQWKSAVCIKANAQEAGLMMEELERTVGLTKETLLEANRKEGTVLHNEFTWNDTEAAEAYRLEQAKHILSNITIVTGEKNETPVRAFFSIAQDTVKDRRYESLRVIVSDETKIEKLMQTAIRELTAFRKKYTMLTKLNRIFAEIDELWQNIGKE